MRAAALALACMAAACGTLSEAPKTYEQIRAEIVTGVDPATGQPFASSEAAAIEDIDRSPMMHGVDESGSAVGASAGRSTIKRYFYAVKLPDGGAKVFIETRSSQQVSDTEVQYKPWPEKYPEYGRVWVGTPWTETRRELVEFARTCEGSLNCRHVERNRIALSDDQVKAALNDPKRTDIRVGVWQRVIDWQMQRDELAATLDALGVTERFR